MVSLSKKLFFGLLISLIAMACDRTTPAPPEVLIDQRLSITPEAPAVAINGNATFTVILFDEKGEPTTLDQPISWASSDPAVATINAQGVATGLKAGQVTITANYSNLKAETFLTVVDGDTQIATIVVKPENPELSLGQTVDLVAETRNINGNTLSNKTFSWELVSGENTIEITKEGKATAKAYGTAQIRVSSENIKSAPINIFVVRKGNFTSRSSGQARKRLVNNNVVLEFSGDFTGSSAPDLKVYLSNTSGSISGAFRLANLQSRTGAQSYNLPSDITINQYRYIVIWCDRFGGVYGNADLGE